MDGLPWIPLTSCKACSRDLSSGIDFHLGLIVPCIFSLKLLHLSAFVYETILIQRDVLGTQKLILDL